MASRSFIIALLVGGALLLGFGSVLVADSPYDSNNEVERNPVAPERPPTLNETTAVRYISQYEETIFSNSILSSRGYTLDQHDEIRATCDATSVTQTDTEQFRVRLRCTGRVIDTNRLIQPSTASYTVEYRVTSDMEEQLALKGYPYSARDELRDRPLQ